MSLPYRHPARSGSSVSLSATARPVAVFLLVAGAWVGGVLTLFQR